MDDFSFTGLAECDILIYLCVSNEDTKQLVLTNKSIARVCSSEHYYRLRIIKYFNADLFEYVEEEKKTADDVDKPKLYQKAYRGLAHLFCRYEHWPGLIKIGMDKTISWHGFDFACERGYLSIIKQTNKEQMKTDNENFEEYMEDIAEGLCDKEKLDVLELLIKEYDVSLRNYQWNIICTLSKNKDTQGYKKWFGLGLDLKKDYQAWALRVAAEEGFSDLAEFLIENGAVIVPVEYSEAWDPIVYAVKYCSVKVVKMMVERGQNIHWNDNFLFSNDMWKGYDRLEKSEPSPEMLDYLSSIQKLTWI